MASEVVITQAIEAIVRDTYSFWTIGVTDSPETCRTHQGNPSVWHVWKADSELDARIVEAHFVGKGMKKGIGVPGKAVYGYLYAW